MMDETVDAAGPPGYGLRRLDGDLDAFYLLRAGINRIGTQRDNEVAIVAAGISRVHAELRVTANGILLVDLASKNGTAVNGRPCENGALHCGDEIELGTVRLRLEPAPVAETDLAIQLSSWREGSASTRTRCTPRDTETDLPPSRSVAQEPLAILEVFGGHLASGEERSRARALGALMTSLTAQGAAWLELEASGSTVLRAATGTVPPIDRLSFLVAQAARSAEPVTVYEDRTLGEPVVVALARSAMEHGGAALVFSGLELASYDPRLLRILALSAVIASQGHGKPLRGDAVADPIPSRQDVLRFPPGYIAGTSVAAAKLHREIALVCATDVPLLILGATGVGKEKIAQLCHRSCHRRNGPFVALNCAAIPDELVEAELFGIARGVATGVTGREGRFQQAAGGTLFLDEIGELSVAIQVKLLRVLQEKEVQPLGAAPRAIDVRILAATNASLHEGMAAGRFRADLYYRLAGAVIEVPALHERCDDLPALVEHFIRRFARETKRRVRGVTFETLERLAAYSWPGNIRELEHEIRRLVLQCPDRQPLRAAAISPHIRGDAGWDLTQEAEAVAEGDGELDLATRQWHIIERALAKTGGNQTHAARLLGISRFALRRRIDQRGACASPAQH